MEYKKVTNNFYLSQDKFINSGFYGDIYQLDSTKVVKLFRRTKLWTESNNTNFEDCDLIRKTHCAVETWMLSKALEWNSTFFPKYYGKLSEIIFTDNQALENNYIPNCSLVIELLTGKEFIDTDAYKTEHELTIKNVISHLDEISKEILAFGCVYPHDCAIFIDDNKSIKMTDIGGWDDSKYTEHYRIHGELSNDLRQEITDFIKKLES
jgi:hypothetical protein